MYAHGIEIEMKKLVYITKQDLISILASTDEGITEILKRKSTMTLESSMKLYHLENINLNEALDYLLLHPELLKTPIVLDKNKYMIGYQEEVIRQFLPMSYRNRKYYI